MNMLQSWNDWRPSKASLGWTAVGASVLTMVVGFTWGGWVTGGTAQTMAEEALQNGREKLVAAICVERFASEPNANQKLAELKEARTYQRDDFIEDGGWITLTALEEQVTGAADLCASQLVAMESLPEQAAQPDTPVADTSTADG